MQSLLFDIPAVHVATFAGTAALLALVSVTAALLPASRAASVDPMEALRAD
jgi:ABC-type lipoprotein release transport system permease subunit